MNRPLARVCAATALFCISSSVFAMQPCPEGAVKPWWDDALGYGVLLLAMLGGLAAPWLAWRGTRALRGGMRALFIALACLVMLGIWAAGFLVWLGGFALRC